MVQGFRIGIEGSRSSIRPPAFDILAGIAAGSYLAEKSTKKKNSVEVLQIIGVLLLSVGTISVFLPPLVAVLQWKGIWILRWAPVVAQVRWANMWFLLAAPAFFLAAALIGSVMPLLCQAGVPAGARAGSEVSWTY